MKRISFLLLLAVGFSGASALADQTMIFGMGAKSKNSDLPEKLCVKPNDIFRFRADVIGKDGKTLNLPANAFLWKMTLTDGRWVIWDARVSMGYGPFWRGRETNSVYVRIPRALGPWGKIEAVAPGNKSILMWAQDVAYPTKGSCQWAPAEIYVQGKPDGKPPKKDKDGDKDCDKDKDKDKGPVPGDATDFDLPGYS